MLGSRQDSKLAALREFPEGKASAARGACENFPSGKLLVGEFLHPPNGRWAEGRARRPSYEGLPKRRDAARSLKFMVKIKPR